MNWKTYGKWWAGALSALLLTVGAAAAAVQNASIPSGDCFAVHADVIVGRGPDEHIDLRGPDEHIDLRVAFDQDGVIRLDGAPIGSHTPGAPYRVDILAHKTGGTWFADVYVIEADGSLAGSEVGYAIGSVQPVMAIASAEAVLSLVVY